jgi:hypothetical protein
VSSRRTSDRTYYKFLVTVPEALVRKLQWEPGAELVEVCSVESHVLTQVRRMKSSKVPKKMVKESSYDEFQSRIAQELRKHPEGRSWSQIRDALRLPQKVPNNAWVRQMENDIGLLRLKSATGTLWRLK